MPASVKTLADEERFYDTHRFVYREEDWVPGVGVPYRAPCPKFQPAQRDLQSLQRLAKRRGKPPATVFSDLVRAALRASGGSR